MGGSSGGSAGEIAYPAYMEKIHWDWLNKNDTEAVDHSITYYMKTAQDGVSPFSTFSTAVPATVMGYTAAMVTPYQAVMDLAALDLTTLFTDFFDILDDNAQILATVAAEAAMLDARLVADVLPRFQRGMRDMGSVLTTGFTLGQANIEASHDLSVAKLDAELRLQSRRLGWQLSLQWVQINIDWNRTVAALSDEVAIRYLEARMKVDQLDVEMSAKDRLFDLEVFQYGGNLMASIAGATSTTKPETSMISAALGGVLSGAAAGAKIGGMIGAAGGPIGAAGGAAIGGLLGLAAAIF